MTWDPAEAEKFCAACGRMRGPLDCAHLRAAARATMLRKQNAPVHERRASRAPAGASSGGGDGGWLAEAAETLFECTIGLLLRGLSALFGGHD